MIKLKGQQRKRTYPLIWSAALALLLAIGLVLPAAPAQSAGEPAIPHEFYGYVYVGGSLAAAGTKVEAYVGGAKAAETTVTASHSYGLQVPGTTGATVTFRVGGVLANQSLPWEMGGITELNLTVSGTPPLDIVTACPLSGGVVSQSYTATLQASGGTSPYTWSIASGSLPTGISLNSTTGVISGTPTATGTSSFTLRVTDSASHQATKSCSLTIGSSGTLTIVTACPLPGGVVNQTYSAVTLQASGGTSPYTWSIVSGSLPNGITLTSAGVISGKPTVAGTFNFTLKVTDRATPAATKEKNCSLTISATPGLPAPTRLPPETIIMRWNAVPDATRYWLQVSPNSRFTSNNVFDGDVGNVTSYELPVTVTSARYYWRVRAGDASGWSSNWSNIGFVYWR